MYGRRGGAALSRAVKTNSHGPDETTARTKPRARRSHHPEEATARKSGSVWRGLRESGCRDAGWRRDGLHSRNRHRPPAGVLILGIARLAAPGVPAFHCFSPARANRNGGGTARVDQKGPAVW